MPSTAKRSLLWGAAVVMLLGAAYRLTDEFHRLVFEHSEIGARDLGHRYREVAAWFSGADVYDTMRLAVYPPSSYVLLWPHVGWLSWPDVRWLWGVTTVGALVWLSAQILRALPLATGLERVCAVLLVLSIHGTGSTVGNGQLLLHTLPALVASALLLRGPASVTSDSLAVAALIWASVKPNAAAPFVLLVLMFARRLRPTMMFGAAYMSLTLVGVSFRDESAFRLLRGWIHRLGDVDVFAGYADAHSWLTVAGFEDLRLAASLAILAVFAVWAWHHLTADVWNLLGVTAIVARVFAYHRPYDDALILLPMVALARIALGHRDSGVASLLLVANWCGAIAPAYYILQYPALGMVFQVYQSLTWLTTLGYLATRMLVWRFRGHFKLR